MNCKRQLDCENYYWQHHIRSHGVRMVYKCEHWKDGVCELEFKVGAACDIKKMQRIRKEHGFGK